jgi:hypothetical protein
MLKACMAAKATRVVASLYQRQDGGRCEVTEIIDTDEVMTWPK